MAKVDLNSPFLNISGKINKKDDVVYRTRNGKTSRYRMNVPVFGGSDKQLRHQELVREVNRLVSEELKIEERKVYWQSVAESEENRYKTARGAAFAYFLAKLKG
jgi:hypothetical protein